MKRRRGEVQRHLQNNTSLLISLWPCEYSSVCCQQTVTFFDEYFALYFLQKTIFDLDYKRLTQPNNKVMFWTPGRVVAVIMQTCTCFECPSTVCFSCIIAFTKDDGMTCVWRLKITARINGPLLDGIIRKDVWHILTDTFHDEHHKHHHHHHGQLHHLSLHHQALLWPTHHPKAI